MTDIESAIECAIAIMRMKNERKRNTKRVTSSKGYTSLFEDMLDVDDIEEARKSTLIFTSSSSPRLVMRRGAVCESGELERILVKEALKQLLLRQSFKDLNL